MTSRPKAHEEEHITFCMERVRRSIDALIDAIEFMKHLDS